MRGGQEEPEEWSPSDISYAEYHRLLNLRRDLLRRLDASSNGGSEIVRAKDLLRYNDLQVARSTLDAAIEMRSPECKTLHARFVEECASYSDFIAEVAGKFGEQGRPVTDNSKQAPSRRARRKRSGDFEWGKRHTAGLVIGLLTVVAVIGSTLSREGTDSPAFDTTSNAVDIAIGLAVGVPINVMLTIWIGSALGNLVNWLRRRGRQAR
jgi:hypothetical protein